MCFNIVLIDMPDERKLCRNSLQNDLQEDLAAVCQLMAEDADNILVQTGAEMMALGYLSVKLPLNCVCGSMG